MIGARARRVRAAEALSVVGGYTVANDISMRDYQYYSHQWLQGKARDRSTPVGPELVTPDGAGDPAALTLCTTVNGIGRIENRMVAEPHAGGPAP